MNKMYAHFIKTLILVSIIAINCNVFAQTADCDSPGDFSVVPVDNVGGTGTADDPYQICSNSLLTVQSNGVNPNLGFPNPGLAFIIYLCNPGDTNPDDDLYDGESGCFTALALAETDGSSYIINNGTAIFNETGIDWDVLGGLPLNIIIVPVILTDINNEASISYDCSSIDLNADYPHFIISNPLVNPDCGIDPGACTVEGGTISTDDNIEFCDDQEVAPNDINLSVDGDDGANYAYFLTDEDGDIYAGPFDMPVIETINTVNTSGISLIYGLSYDDDAFPDFNIGDNISTLVGECAKLSENSIEIIFYTSNAGEIGTDDNTDFSLCTDDDKTVTVTSTGLEADFSGYVLTDENGVVLSLIQEDGIFDFNDVTEVSEFHIYGIASSFALSPIELGSNIEEFDFISCVKATSNFVTVTFEECDPTCEADAGSISDFSDFYCNETSISPTNDGFNSSNDFAQVYLLTDAALNILAVGTDTEFSLETGAYLFHALNVAVDEAPSDLEDLIGLNAQDVLAGLDCFNLETSGLITVLEPITISENNAECNDADNTIIAEISISGGLPNNDATTSYEISGDATGTADADGIFTIEVDNTVEEVTLDVTDDTGCSSSITISFATLNCEVDPTCEADAGSISDVSEFYCTTTSISPNSNGFNSSNDYAQVYLLTDDALNILAVDTDTEFSLETGSYLFHALNVAVDEAPSDLEGLIGLNAQDVLAGLDCFNLETSGLITVLEPIDISENAAECNDADNTIIAEINISGGLPNSDATTSYEISGDATGTADADGLFTIEVDNTVEEVTLDVTDDTGCSSSITISFATLNCEVDPTCEADAGLISGFSDFYCASTTISPASIGFNSSTDFVQVYLLTDDALNILAVGTDTEFSLNAGAYLFHALNVAVDEAPADLEGLIGLNAQDVLAGLDCFSLETSSLMTVLEPLNYSIESIGCNAATGLYDLVLNITGGLPSNDNTVDYSLSGDLSESVDADGILAFSAEPSTTIEFSISDDEGCLVNVEYQVASCDSNPCDDLASGTISTNSVPSICASVDTFDVFYFVEVELDGNQSNNFAYFTTDADGLILDGPIDLPEFTFDLTEAGSYQIFGAAYEGSLNFTIGESIFDVSASECLALTNSIIITIEDCIEDITIGDPIFEVDDATGTYTITFGVFGGTGIYTGTNGVFDENIFNSVEFNCGDSATIVITDDAGNETEVTFEAPCEAVVECPGDSEAGTLSVSTTLLCANSVLTVGSTGFNNGAEYTQLYIATTGSNYIIAALSENGMFEGLASGVYQMHALNYYNSDAPTLPNIGESAANILNQTNACFDLDVNDAITVTILNPIEAVIDYSCNPETGIYTLTFSFNGGLPQYVAENGSAGIAGETIYTVSGDLNGPFTYGENIVIDYTENTSYSMNFYDAFGCVGSDSGTPSACSKTAVELLVFDGEAKEEGNLIYWATASEYNSDYFILEKSKDGITWEQIKSKKAAINSNQSVSYEYLDASNVTGMSYYRLISFDLDGQSDATEVITVRNSRVGFEVESIFPIPAQNNISVNVYLSDYQEVKIEIYSLEGKMMKQEIQLGDAGLNKINMDIFDFAAGVYWIQISSKMELFSQKIIKAL